MRSLAMLNSAMPGVNMAKLRSLLMQASSSAERGWPYGSSSPVALGYATHQTCHALKVTGHGEE